MQKLQLSALLTFALLVSGTIHGADTSTWSGTNNGLWNSNINWGGNALVSGNAVVFPSGPSNKTTQNDFPTTLTLGPININASNYILNGNAITLGGGIFLNGASSTAQIGLPLGLTGSQAFTISSSSSTLIVSGVISDVSGSNGITKTGSGWLNLQGAHTYSGETIIDAGVLILGPNGSTPANIPGRVQIGTGYLAGTGTVGGIVSLGTGAQISPGNSTTAGTLTSAGDVVLSATDSINLKVATSTADRLNITGTLNLGGAPITIFLANGIDRAINADVLLIQNDGDDQGDPVVVSGSAISPFLINLPIFESRHYQLSLVGGNGNDVVLRRVATNASTTTLASSASGGIAFGGSVKFTANVSSPAGMVAGIPVVFRDGIHVIGTANTDITGKAELTTTALEAGNRQITAMFGGDNSRKPSVSSVVIQPVTSFSTTVILSVTPDTVDPTPVTLTGAITTTGVPNGTMGFYDNGILLGSVPVTAISAQLTGVNLTAGSHSLMARFIGTGAYVSDDSPVVIYNVTGGSSTTTTLMSSANPAQAGDSISLVATVGAGTPTGTVIFRDGAVTLATKTLVGGTATLVTSALSAGTHSLTVAYQGAATFQPSTSSALSQVITAAPGGGGSSGGASDSGGGGCGLGSGTAAAIAFGFLLLLMRLRRD
jgi:autotransporter-associated beta strand protein